MYLISILLIQYQQIAAGCRMQDARIAYRVLSVAYCVLRVAYCVLRIPIKDIGAGLVLRNDRVAVPLFSKGFCLAGGIIPK